MSLFSQVKHFQVFLTLKGYHALIWTEIFTFDFVSRDWGEQQQQQQQQALFA